MLKLRNQGSVLEVFRTFSSKFELHSKSIAWNYNIITELGFYPRLVDQRCTLVLNGMVITPTPSTCLYPLDSFSFVILSVENK